MARQPAANWWEVRTAHNRKPATYRCPLCGEYLPALSDHMLMFPEGDHSRRRHAHAQCVFAARRAGRLPTREEWERARRSERAGAGTRTGTGTGTGEEERPPAPPGPLGRLRERLAARRH
jgi:hypothetical protein